MSEDKKKEYWGEERNAQRRHNYQADPNHAERLRAARRESYRRRKDNASATLLSCARNIEKITGMGSMVAVRIEGTDLPLKIEKAYRQTDVAQLVERKPPIIYRWVQNGQLPPPALVDDLGNRYYSEAEVRTFVTVLGELQSRTRHYRADHTEVRDKLFAASIHAKK